MRIGRRKRKARALESANMRTVLIQREPHIAMGYKRPLGGLWQTRGGVWSKTEAGRRRLLASVAWLQGARAEEAREFARIREVLCGTRKVWR